MTLRRGGADFAVYAGHAESVSLCLFDEGDVDGSSERRVELGDRAHGVWFGFVPDIGLGQRYGIRVDGPWDPESGQRHNPHKLLMDPYAKAIEGEVRWGPEVFGHVVDDGWNGDGYRQSELDSAAYMPRSVIIDDHNFDWGFDEPPQIPRSDSLIYEVHVKELTRLHPEVPPELRGTYAGLANPPVVDYLKRLGVTAVELLPIHAFTHEPHLVQRGLVNHWGYNSIGFFAPQAAYAHDRTPQGAVNEFKGMVKILHEHDIEVILDVVYNHTAEQSAFTGATLSWRGLDSRAYYRLDDRGRDVDVTGCGNTLDLRHPMVAQQVLDSLRYWVEVCHVDGFRFDLAVALGRGRGKGDDYDPDHPFLVALRTDPVLSRVKLIAEPWDLGLHGWRTGQFPPPFSEWNDRFRDAVRTYWLADFPARAKGRPGRGVQDLATRIAGSQDLFGTRDRGPQASVNFVTAHDGFTAYDLTAYAVKHNEANGEGNRDGSDGNSSWNHGHEGELDPDNPGEAQMRAERVRSVRNLLATTLLATGVPMLNSGDEYGRTQHGNNNVYCQDNELTWMDWDLAPWQVDLLETTRYLSRIRAEHTVLRQRTFFSGRTVHQDGSTDLAWYDACGQPMQWWQWEDPTTRSVQVCFNGAWLGHTSILIVFHGAEDDDEFVLASPPGVRSYQLLWDSAWERPRELAEPFVPGRVHVTARSMQVYLAVDPT
ncbi:glycogen debranching protein GlgX [Actinomycetota bacterium]